jgi:hypothetical protein
LKRCLGSVATAALRKRRKSNKEIRRKKRRVGGRLSCTGLFKGKQSLKIVSPDMYLPYVKPNHNAGMLIDSWGRMVGRMKDGRKNFRGSGANQEYLPLLLPNELSAGKPEIQSPSSPHPHPPQFVITNPNSMFFFFSVSNVRGSHVFNTKFTLRL